MNQHQNIGQRLSNINHPSNELVKQWNQRTFLPEAAQDVRPGAFLQASGRTLPARKSILCGLLNYEAPTSKTIVHSAIIPERGLPLLQDEVCVSSQVSLAPSIRHISSSNIQSVQVSVPNVAMIKCSDSLPHCITEMQWSSMGQPRSLGPPTLSSAGKNYNYYGIKGPVRHQIALQGYSPFANLKPSESASDGGDTSDLSHTGSSPPREFLGKGGHGSTATVPGKDLQELSNVSTDLHPQPSLETHNDRKHGNSLVPLTSENVRPKCLEVKPRMQSASPKKSYMTPDLKSLASNDVYLHQGMPCTSAAQITAGGNQSPSLRNVAIVGDVANSDHIEVLGSSCRELTSKTIAASSKVSAGTSSVHVVSVPKTIASNGVNFAFNVDRCENTCNTRSAAVISSVMNDVHPTTYPPNAPVAAVSSHVTTLVSAIPSVLPLSIPQDSSLDAEHVLLKTFVRQSCNSFAEPLSDLVKKVVVVEEACASVKAEISLILHRIREFENDIEKYFQSISSSNTPPNCEPYGKVAVQTVPQNCATDSGIQVSASPVDKFLDTGTSSTCDAHIVCAVSNEMAPPVHENLLPSKEAEHLFPEKQSGLSAYKTDDDDDVLVVEPPDEQFSRSGRRGSDQETVYFGLGSGSSSSVASPDSIRSLSTPSTEDGCFNVFDPPISEVDSSTPTQSVSNLDETAKSKPDLAIVPSDTAAASEAPNSDKAIPSAKVIYVIDDESEIGSRAQSLHKVSKFLSLSESSESLDKNDDLQLIREVSKQRYDRSLGEQASSLGKATAKDRMLRRARENEEDSRGPKNPKYHE